MCSAWVNHSVWRLAVCYVLLDRLVPDFTPGLSLLPVSSRLKHMATRCVNPCSTYLCVSKCVVFEVRCRSKKESSIKPGAVPKSRQPRLSINYDAGH